MKRPTPRYSTLMKQMIFALFSLLLAMGAVGPATVALNATTLGPIVDPIPDPVLAGWTPSSTTIWETLGLPKVAGSCVLPQMVLVEFPTPEIPDAVLWRC